MWREMDNVLPSKIVRSGSVCLLAFKPVYGKFTQNLQLANRDHSQNMNEVFQMTFWSLAHWGSIVLSRVVTRRQTWRFVNGGQSIWNSVMQRTMGLFPGCRVLDVLMKQNARNRRKLNPFFSFFRSAILQPRKPVSFKVSLSVFIKHNNETETEALLLKD
jgi:hypothetical protein